MTIFDTDLNTRPDRDWAGDEMMKLSLKSTGGDDKATNNLGKGQCLPLSSTLICKALNEQRPIKARREFWKVADQTDLDGACKQLLLLQSGGERSDKKYIQRKEI